jgi:small-conductance mechanosensitive channel
VKNYWKTALFFCVLWFTPAWSVLAQSHSPALSLRSTTPSAQAATLRLLNRDIATLRAVLGGLAPQERVERARQRFNNLPDGAIDLPIKAAPYEFEQSRGVQFMFGDHKLFVLLEADMDVESQQTLENLTPRVLTRLHELRSAWHATRDRLLLLQGLLKTSMASVVLGLFLWGLARITRRTALSLEAWRDRIAANSPDVDWRELLARLVVGSIHLLQWLVILLVLYYWLHFVLSSFFITQPLAIALGEWFWQQLTWVASGILHSIPSFMTVIIVLVLTRAVTDVLGYFFNAVQHRRLEVPFLHPETITATRRIAIFIVWGLGIAIAYPHLPGSDSEAFKGLSVLFGIMVTLGSAGLVTQAMSGLVVIYARALRKGDFVQVNGVQGVVTEIASLATKIINVHNEEITIPNAVLVSSPIHNYSKTGIMSLTTSVTIGYDTPWRQVHAMLLEAAAQTPGVCQQPAPRVYQRSLSDFYIEYELFVALERSAPRVAIQSVLHGSIQDTFNAHGVQIMSPHFEMQPEGKVMVPKQDWYKAPAPPLFHQQINTTQET